MKAKRVPRREESPDHRYQTWAGDPEGIAQDPTKCVATVADGGRSMLSYQCGKKRGHGSTGLYCKQHAMKYDPEGEPETWYRLRSGPYVHDVETATCDAIDDMIEEVEVIGSTDTYLQTSYGKIWKDKQLVYATRLEAVEALRAKLFKQEEDLKLRILQTKEMIREIEALRTMEMRSPIEEVER